MTTHLHRRRDLDAPGGLAFFEWAFHERGRHLTPRIVTAVTRLLAADDIAATSPSAEAGPRPPARTGIGSVKPVEFVEAVEAVEAVNTVEEDLHAIVDTGEAGRERQPQGVVVHRFSLERAG